MRELPLILKDVRMHARSREKNGVIFLSPREALTVDQPPHGDAKDIHVLPTSLAP